MAVVKRVVLPSIGLYSFITDFGVNTGPTPCQTKVDSIVVDSIINAQQNPLYKNHLN